MEWKNESNDKCEEKVKFVGRMFLSPFKKINQILTERKMCTSSTY